MPTAAGLLLTFVLYILAARSRADILRNDTVSASRNTTLRYANASPQSWENATTAFANISSTNASTEHFTHGKPATRAYNVWPKNGTNLDGNLAIFRRLQKFGLSQDQIMCSQLGSTLIDVNFFTADMTDDQAYDMKANTKEASPQNLEIQESGGL